jgi:hypothetical protein
MKEPSIKQKAKAYDEALKRARKELQACGSTVCDAARQIFRFFPELKESEDVDRKIREEIIATIHLYYGEPLEDEAKEMIAWLEKQEGCEYIKKDWLEHIKQSWYKEGFIDGKYSGGTSKEWTINDAATLKELIDFLENGTAKLQHDLTRYANWLEIKLESLRPQNTWKPSDDQMKALAWALSLAKNCGEECAFDLRTLQEQLKNL